MSGSSSTPRPKAVKVGTRLDDVPDGALVERPDGTTNTVRGGVYLLDQAGTFVVAGDRYKVG